MQDFTLTPTLSLKGEGDGELDYNPKTPFSPCTL